jgi:hypothetical protein
MSKRDVLGRISAYGSKGGAKEFYDMQELLFPGSVKAPLVSRASNRADAMKPLVSSTGADPTEIATMFAIELQALRDDPAFTGSDCQIDYLKDIISTDTYFSK